MAPSAGADEGRTPGRPWVGRGLIYGAAILLILTVGVFTYHSSRELVGSYASIDRTLTVLQTLDRFLATLRDAEIAHRSYVVTGSPDDLAQYEATLPTFAPILDDLAALTRLKPLQHGLAQELGRRTLDWIAAAQRAVEARSPPGSGGAMDEVGGAREAMDAVRTVARELRTEEERLFARRRADAQRRTTISGALVLATVGVSLAAMIGAFLLLRREAGCRAAAQDQLSSANAGLESAIAHRTRELAAEAEGHRVSAETLQAIIEESPVPIVALDDGGRVTIWNRAAERVFGASSIDMIGGRFPPEGQGGDDLGPLLGRLAAGERVRSTALTLPCADGRLAELMVSGVALLTRDGLVHAFVLLLEDMSEKRVLEQQLAQANRLEAVGQLTGGMAHDFNNLLTIIVGNLDLLLEETTDTSEGRRLAGEALDASLRGADLVRQLLAFARRQTLLPTVLNLNDRLPALVSMLTRTLGESVTVVTRPEQGLHDVRVDRTQLENAIVNLALNARDAMPQGGRLTIETANETFDHEYTQNWPDVPPGSYVMLAVSDTGMGMPQEVLARVFEPFFTTKPEGSGTGLGLSMVYGFVKQSGGHIRIDSEVGFGTSVKLYLPSIRTEREPEEASEQAALLTGQGQTVLVVEDQDAVRAVAARQIESLGYTVVMAKTGDEALGRIAEGGIDLVFTDVVMPGGMTGFDLVRRIEAEWPDLPVIFTSGYTAQGAAGAVDGSHTLLSKPYRKRELAQALRAELAAPGDTEEA